MKKDIENLSEWIENREMRGYYTFTKEDIEKQGLYENLSVPFGH